MNRTEEIRRRHAERKPLNISAVLAEAPHLLEGLWDPAEFKGWRQTVEAAGIPIESIHVRMATETQCPICGWAGDRLQKHLSQVHSTTIGELRAEFPEAEDYCEELRNSMMGRRYGRPALALAPHWEPAWSKYYALDRLRWLYESGRPVNYQHVAEHEPGLAAYLRRVLGSWDAALKAAGLHPEKLRMAAEKTAYSPEEIRQELLAILAENPKGLAITRARATTFRVLVTACFREFGSYENALREAGADPVRFIPALADAEKVRQREDLLAAVRARRVASALYDAREVSAFLRKAKPIVRDFFGTWTNLCTGIGCLERDVFHPPPFTRYRTEAAIVRSIRERAQTGLPLREADVRTDNSPLLIQAILVFGQWSGALAAAKVQRPPRMEEQRHYTRVTLLTALQERHARGDSLNSTVVNEEPSGRIQFKWAVRYYGSWHAALEAAGLGAFIHVRERPPARFYPTPGSIVEALRARAAAGGSLQIKSLQEEPDSDSGARLYRASLLQFGSWLKALRAAGLEPAPRGVRKGKYTSAEQVIAALRDRQASGISCRGTDLRHGGHRDFPLFDSIGKFFPNHSAALTAAGVPLPSSLVNRLHVFPDADAVIRGIRERQAAGIDFTHDRLATTPGGRALYNAARRHFGEFSKAVKAAGFKLEDLKHPKKKRLAGTGTGTGAVTGAET